MQQYLPEASESPQIFKTKWNKAKENKTSASKKRCFNFYVTDSPGHILSIFADGRWQHWQLLFYLKLYFVCKDSPESFLHLSLGVHHFCSNQMSLPYFNTVYMSTMCGPAILTCYDYTLFFYLATKSGLG